MTAWRGGGRTVASPSRLARAAPPLRGCGLDRRQERAERRRDAELFRPAGDHATDGPEVRKDGTRADQDRWRRLSPRPSPRAGPARRGRGRRNPHHGIERQSAQNPCRSVGRKAGYVRRSQFCSEVAEREGFEPSVPQKSTTVFETAPIDRSGTSPAPRGLDRGI